MFRGIAGGLRQAQGEAAQAAGASFGFVLQARHLGFPVGVVVVGIDEIEVFRCYEADGLVFARFVFFLRVDVGVAVEHSRAQSVGQHAFDDGRRAGSAARVEQYAGVAVGSLEFEHGSWSGGRDSRLVCLPGDKGTEKSVRFASFWSEMLCVWADCPFIISGESLLLPS